MCSRNSDPIVTHTCIGFLNILWCFRSGCRRRVRPETIQTGLAETPGTARTDQLHIHRPIILIRAGIMTFIHWWLCVCVCVLFRCTPVWVKRLWLWRIILNSPRSWTWPSFTPGWWTLWTSSSTRQPISPSSGESLLRCSVNPLSFNKSKRTLLDFCFLWCSVSTRVCLRRCSLRAARTCLCSDTWWRSLSSAHTSARVSIRSVPRRSVLSLSAYFSWALNYSWKAKLH